MARWRIELLGGLRATKGERAVTHFESRKTAALLAYLALHPERRFPREELAALIWPDADDVSGRNRLKQSLASLRKLFEADEPVFDADRFAIGLLPGAVETDASEWERLARAGRKREAHTLWRGELLPGFYDDFLLGERERLNALREDLCPNEERATPRRVSLPASTTRFVGRAGERARLAEVLKTERWITLTGPGGMGKTRLAVEAARAFEDGDVAFVALAELARAEAVPAALAAALEFPLPPGREPLDALVGFLKDRPTLLVLDNAEHLELVRLSELCARLLARLPELKLLVTSRRVLGGAGEVRFPLEPLLPAEEARALFLDRARRVRPDFPDTDDILALCQVLEGMPLAIELCAAWAGALATAQMKERLERGERARLLTRRGSGGEAHHRSVEAAFLSSYARLTPERQALLRGLSVFRGGWTLDAAEAVCPAHDTLGDLLALADASLIAPRGLDRFEMLESLRFFAAGLAEEAESARLRFARFDWASNLVCRSLHGSGDEAEGLARLDEEWDNLRGAIETAPPEDAARLTLSLERFIRLRARSDEAISWLQRALNATDLPAAIRAEARVRLATMTADREGLPVGHAHLDAAEALLADAPEPRVLAQARYQRGRLLVQANELERARAQYEAALALWETLGDDEGRARALQMLAQVTIYGKDLESGRRLQARAEELARKAGRSSLLAEILIDRTMLAALQDDYEASLRIGEECESRARALKHPRLLAKVWNNLGEAARNLGDESRARHAYLESLRLFGKMREWRLAYIPLWNLAQLYGGWDEFDVALPTMSCAVRILEELNRPPEDEDAAEIAALRARAESAIGAELAEFLWRQGRLLAPDEAIARLESRQPLKIPRP